MREGEIARLRCAPAYAFGPAGSPPKIPPNATVECRLELLSWADKTARWSRLADQYTGSDVPEEDIYAKYKKDLEVHPHTEDGVVCVWPHAGADAEGDVCRQGTARARSRTSTST